MRAIRIYDSGALHLEKDVPRPEARAGEVVLEVALAGICGTDASLVRHGVGLVPRSADPRWPIVLGHEFSGRVVEVGDGVESLAVGEPVACGAGASCGACRACRAGRTNLCEHYWTAGVHRDGGLAEFCVVPAAICEPTEPHGVRGDALGLTQPMAIAVHAIDRGRAGPGDRALIIGAGGIGALGTWVASQLGVEVTVCDRDPARTKIAAGLGAAHTYVVDEVPLEDRLDGDGDFDVVYEMTGVGEPLAAAVSLVRPGGRVVAVGVHARDRLVDVGRVTTGEIDLVGAMAHVCATDLPRALDFVAARAEGWADLAPAVLTLEEVVTDGLPEMVAGRAKRIKTLVDPSAATTRPYAPSADEDG